METHLYANVLGDIQQRERKGAKPRCTEINLGFKTLQILRAGKQKFKKRHVISSTSHMEKMVDLHAFMFSMRITKVLARLHKCAESSELSLLVLAITNTANCCLCLLNIHVDVYLFGDQTPLTLYNSRFTLTSQTTENKH